MTNAIERTGRRLGRRPALGAALASIAWSGRAVAQAPAQYNDARRPVADLYAGLAAIGRTGGAFQQQFNQLAPVITRDFDLDTILRTSVGTRWTSLDANTQSSLTSVFQAFTVASYVANFGKGGGEKFEVLPDIKATGSDQIVGSRLVPASGDPVRIDYLIRNGRIVDVLFNGSISRVAVQRSDFRSLLASGSATPLIDSLRKKVADLSGGAMRP
jgi:phospholipid transport system substrate-binding protein